MPRSHTGVRGMVFVDKMSGPAYGIRQKWDSFCAAMQQKVKAGEEMELLESQKDAIWWMLALCVSPVAAASLVYVWKGREKKRWPNG